MDIFGNNGNYFRATIWSWRPICFAIELSDYPVPESWSSNNGAGLDTQEDCNKLAEQLAEFLAKWDGNILTIEQDEIRINEQGYLVKPNSTEETRSPYRASRENIQEFVDFLRDCDGFQIT